MTPQNSQEIWEIHVLERTYTPTVYKRGRDITKKIKKCVPENVLFSKLKLLQGQLILLKILSNFK